jgi:hypothetical protein
VTGFGASGNRIKDVAIAGRFGAVSDIASIDVELEGTFTFAEQFGHAKLFPAYFASDAGLTRIDF